MRTISIAAVAAGFIAHGEAFTIGMSTPAPAAARCEASRMMFGGGGDKEGGGFMCAIRTRVRPAK